MKVCFNCNFRFERGESCPRCHSKKIKELEFKENVEGAAQDKRPLVFDRSGQRIFGDTKEAWKSFHNRVQTVCPNCGGAEFKIDYKHKEKTCVKCGEIMPLPRRAV